MGEHAIAQSSAQCFYYDQGKGGWQALAQGMVALYIYHTPATGAYRIIGMTSAKQVVINSSLFTGIKYSQSTADFHSWTDKQRAYGVRFTDPKIASAFAAEFGKAAAGVGKKEQAQKQQVMATMRTTKAVQQTKPEKKIEVEKVAAVVKKEAQTQNVVVPQAPTPVANNNNAPKAPVATGGGGGGPPPPPPPPAPAPAAVEVVKKESAPKTKPVGQMSLMEQIAANKTKLKKGEPKKETSPPPSSGGGGMMGEMARKLAARRAGSDSGVVKQATPKTNTYSKPKAGSVKPAKKWGNTTGTVPKKPANSNNNNSSADLDKLKEEILTIFRAELKAAKDEIIAAIRGE